MKLTNITIYAQQKKIMRQEMQKKERKRGKQKEKVSKLCFLPMPHILHLDQKATKYSVQPVNGFL